MSITTITPVPALRERAATLLASSNPQARGGAVGALTVLHQLASSPTTAPDALALLHELQVHQVELQLQAEELRDARTELEGTLAFQLARIDAAPVGLFTVDPDTVMQEVNAQGARLLGLTADELLGQPLAPFLSAPDADELVTLLRQAHRLSNEGGCTLHLQPRGGEPVAVHATAARLSDRGPCQLALMRAR